MKIVFFNRFFFPDASATSQILSDLAFHLAAAGANVHVVTSKVPGGMAEMETIRGVTIHRVARAAAEPHGLAQRALAYLGYYRGARRAASELLAPGDIAVLKTDPPMLSAFVGPAAHRRGAKVVAWIQDLFPEVAREYGIAGMAGPLGSWLQRLRNRSLERADRVVAIGERMAARLRAEGVAREKLRVIHNWSDGAAIRPLPREGNALRSRWGLGDAFVVQYSGNLGRVHEFDTLLDAARLLRDERDIRFVIVGRGPRHGSLKERVEREGLHNVTFQPQQPREALAESLAVGDAHVTVLEPRFDGLVVPSKIYGIMAAARPLVFIGDPQGETAGLVAAARCGVSVRSGDGAALAAALRRLKDDAAARDAMGRSGREAFERSYALEKGLALWRQALAELGLQA